MDEDGAVAELFCRPLGVVGAIGPWNWPMMISVWQLARALRMGNAAIIKPSNSKPLSVLALVKVLNTVLSADVLAVIPGGRNVGEHLAGHKGIAKFLFTGSTAAGKAIVGYSADTVKRLTLELGGNDAAIALPDADPETIAKGLFWGAFINTEQTCAALKRLYVHEEIYEEVCAALTAVGKSMPMRNDLDENNVLGPLQNKAQFVDRLVKAPKDSGARVLIGGDPEATQPGFFYPATLIADIDNENPLVA